MEIREIFDTLESDPNIDQELQKEILEKIESIARADQLVDGLEEKIEQHKNELSEKELKYIINKCISYKSVFYRFRNGKIIDYDQLTDITNRIFELEESIRKNNFEDWKRELLAYKGSKEDKEEDKVIQNMLMVVPEERSVVDKVATMFKRVLWKIQQKNKQKDNEENTVIQLPQTSLIDIELKESEFDNLESKVEEITQKSEEQIEEELEDKFGDAFEGDEIEENKEDSKEAEVLEADATIDEKDVECVQERTGASVIEDNEGVEEEQTQRRRKGNKE